MSGKAILITGSHRSGSTWVGKMLSQSPEIVYIHEPFSVTYPPGSGICAAKFDYWFSYVTHENEANYYQSIKDTINFSYNIPAALKSAGSNKRILRIFIESQKYLRYSLSNLRPLLKDPIALFSANWLASRFDMDVVVLVRHPAAFVSSLKLKNWTFPFSHFLEQPLLMRDSLYPFEMEIRAHAKEEKDVVDQAILLWKIFHHRILEYKKKHESWIFVRHEDLSLDSIIGFKSLFDSLKLEFTPQIIETIKDYSSSHNPTEARVDTTHTLKRNSQSNIKNWKNRLTQAEVERIRNQVEYISKEFYSDQDWI